MCVENDYKAGILPRQSDSVQQVGPDSDASAMYHEINVRTQLNVESQCTL